MDAPEPKRRGVGAWLWRRPVHAWRLGLPVGALLLFVVGMAVAGGFVGALKFSSSDGFCTACHEMDAPRRELASSRHGSNPFGVHAGCADCHVPPTFLAGMKRHLAGALEGWGHMTGELDTPAKYESHRLELAQQVWAELKANDSAECRSCHRSARMVAAAPVSAASAGAGISSATIHQSLAASYTCIDCHKGLAHTLPRGV